MSNQALGMIGIVVAVVAGAVLYFSQGFKRRIALSGFGIGVLLIVAAFHGEGITH